MKKLKIISEIAPDALLYEGFDDAIIGVSDVFRDGSHSMVVAYDKNKILEILVDRDGMTELEAEEYFNHNIGDSYLNSNTPIFIDFIWALSGEEPEGEYVC